MHCLMRNRYLFIGSDHFYCVNSKLYFHDLVLMTVPMAQPIEIPSALPGGGYKVTCR